MKTKVVFFQTMPSGYGHKLITIELENGERLSAITNDMHLTDQLQSDDDNTVIDAKKRLSELVLSKYSFNDLEIEF